MRADTLEKQLQNRPKPDELVREGILEGESVCWSILAGFVLRRRELTPATLQRTRTRSGREVDAVVATRRRVVRRVPWAGQWARGRVVLSFRRDTWSQGFGFVHVAVGWRQMDLDGWKDSVGPIHE